MSTRAEKSLRAERDRLVERKKLLEGRVQDVDSAIARVDRSIAALVGGQESEQAE